MSYLQVEAQACLQHDRDAQVLRCDVTKWDDQKALFAKAQETYGAGPLRIRLMAETDLLFPMNRKLMSLSRECCSAWPQFGAV